MSDILLEKKFACRKKDDAAEESTSPSDPSTTSSPVETPPRPGAFAVVGMVGRG